MLACLVLLGLAGIATASVIYVSTSGSDSNNGLSWANAKQTVGAGLGAAFSVDEVWVKAGTYHGLVTLKNGVGLYGGFNGTETARSQRNWSQNVTILDGKDTNGQYIVNRH